MEASCTDLSPGMASQILPPPPLPPSTMTWCLWEGYSPRDICPPLGTINYWPPGPHITVHFLLKCKGGVGAQPGQREALLGRWAVRSHGPLGFSVWPGQPGSTVIECPGAGAHHRPGSAWDHRACGRDLVGSHSWHPDVCSPVL